MASFSASLIEQKDPNGSAISVLSPSGYWIQTPSPACVVALKAEPSVYTCIQSLGYEFVVSRADVLSEATFDFLVDPSMSLVFIVGAFSGKDGGMSFETLSKGLRGSGR